MRMEKPKYGGLYWTISFMRTGDPVFEDVWIGNSMDNNRWENNIVFETKEDADKAAKLIAKLLGGMNNEQ